MTKLRKAVAHAFGTTVAGSLSALGGTSLVHIVATHGAPTKDTLTEILTTAGTLTLGSLSVLTAAFALSQFVRCYQAVRAFEQDIATPVDTGKNTAATRFDAPGFDI